jgi:hypothetical protein
MVKVAIKAQTATVMLRKARISPRMQFRLAPISLSMVKVGISLSMDKVAINPKTPPSTLILFYKVSINVLMTKALIPLLILMQINQLTLNCNLNPSSHLHHNFTQFCLICMSVQLHNLINTLTMAILNIVKSRLYKELSQVTR